jgi:glycosyltransferase involved in cell wall biosynthesis
MKITVITINHNNKSGLEKTIKSVCNQSNTDFEYIVIDGGSSDGSKEIIEDYQNEIACWVSEKDNGIYHAMNKGIKEAAGEFVVFMNSGDVFYNETIIDSLLNQLKDTDEILYVDVLLRNKKTNTERIQKHPEKINFFLFL